MKNPNVPKRAPKRALVAQNQHLFKRAPFSGNLLKPIRRPEPPKRSLLDHDDDEWAEKLKIYGFKEVATIFSLAANKMTDLYKHYGLNPDEEGAAQTLSLYLALDYVPGFKVVHGKKAGPAKLWDDNRLLSLWMNVQFYLLNGFTEIENICALLVQKPFWKKHLNIEGTVTRESIQTLYNHYFESKHSSAVTGSEKLLNHLIQDNETKAKILRLCFMTRNKVKMPVEK